MSPEGTGAVPDAAMAHLVYTQGSKQHKEAYGDIKQVSEAVSFEPEGAAHSPNATFDTPGRAMLSVLCLQEMDIRIWTGWGATRQNHGKSSPGTYSLSATNSSRAVC